MNDLTALTAGCCPVCSVSTSFDRLTSASNSRPAITHTHGSGCVRSPLTPCSKEMDDVRLSARPSQITQRLCVRGGFTYQGLNVCQVLTRGACCLYRCSCRCRGFKDFSLMVRKRLCSVLRLTFVSCSNKTLLNTAFIMGQLLCPPSHLACVKWAFQWLLFSQVGICLSSAWLTLASVSGTTVLCSFELKYLREWPLQGNSYRNRTTPLMSQSILTFTCKLEVWQAIVCCLGKSTLLQWVDNKIFIGSVLPCRLRK